MCDDMMKKKARANIRYLLEKSFFLVPLLTI